MANCAPGSLPPVLPEDNPAVSTVTPEDYPDGRKNANLEAGLDDDMAFERENAGSSTDPRPE